MVINSIDIIKGKAVQLRGGEKIVIEKDNPVELAKEFNRFGEIALIDLDAALTQGQNEELIREICRLADCRVGGGIRTIEKARRLSLYGAWKLIIGTMAIKGGSLNREFLKGINGVIGIERTIIALDVRNGSVLTNGWKVDSGVTIDELLDQLPEFTNEILVTSVQNEGQLSGTDIGFYQKILKMTDLRITAAGGICTYEEISALSLLGINCQVGMAVYSGIIEPSVALIKSLNWEKGLIPTIVTDCGNQVLMLAYSSRESLKRTFETGHLWFFSRSRNRLWEKGETSGNHLEFLKARVDCDHDTLIIQAMPEGPVCHTGSYSCFGTRDFSLYELSELLSERFSNPVQGSFTSGLTPDLIKAKIIEESGELINAKTKEEITWEAADLVYFILCLCSRNNVDFHEVLAELGNRRRTGKPSKKGESI
jgi:phosphoribosyl-ATP pyrophosphohydrolase/phosphoribosyl-AMP cyclohydrolase